MPLVKLLANGCARMKSLITSFILLAFTSLSIGRLVKSWSYQELFDTADLVIVAKSISTKDIKEPQKQPPAPTTGLVAVATEFEIQGVMKGDKTLKKCTLVHFRLKNPSEPRINGPLLVQFDPKQHEAFLLFLHRQPEGEYAPVSGQMDPQFAAMRLDTTWFLKELSKGAK